MTDTLDTSLLHDEHLLLGASMGELWDTGLLVPMCYPGSPQSTIENGATLLFDLTGLPYALLSGSEAQNLAEMTFAGKLLSVGECAFEGVFFGDGTPVGAPFVMRTGEHEYCLLDLAAEGDACVEWVLALSLLEQGGERLFPNTKLEDATDLLVPLLLWGAEAKPVLCDYLNATDSLPRPGEVKSLHLDRILTLMAAVPNLKDAFALLVPTAAARVLWRSLLSFPMVQPAGLNDLSRELNTGLAWQCLLDGSPKPGISALKAHGLVRCDGQFVGMRGLLEG